MIADNKVRFLEQRKIFWHLYASVIFDCFLKFSIPTFPIFLPIFKLSISLNMFLLDEMQVIDIIYSDWWLRLTLAKIIVGL